MAKNCFFNIKLADYHSKTQITYYLINKFYLTKFPVHSKILSMHTGDHTIKTTVLDNGDFKLKYLIEYIKLWILWEHWKTLK